MENSPPMAGSAKGGKVFHYTKNSGRPMLPTTWVKISPHLGGKVGLPDENVGADLRVRPKYEIYKNKKPSKIEGFSRI